MSYVLEDVKLIKPLLIWYMLNFKYYKSDVCF